MTVLREPLSLENAESPAMAEKAVKTFSGAPSDLLEIHYEARGDGPPERFPVENPQQSLDIFLKVSDLVKAELLERSSLQSRKAAQAQRTIDKILSKAKGKRRRLFDRDPSNGKAPWTKSRSSTRIRGPSANHWRTCSARAAAPEK